MAHDVSFNLDFFTGVFFDDTATPIAHPNYMPLWLERDRGLNGYNLAWQDEATGFIKAINSDRPDMGMFVTGGGTALERLMELTNEASRAQAAVHSGLDYARCSRADFCIDVYDDGEGAHEFYNQAVSGHIKTSARTVRFYHGATKKQGVTTYCGSQNGLRMLRVYDKNAESKGLIPATRLEVQTRGKYANELWRRVCADPSHNNFMEIAMNAIRGVIMDTNVPHIEEALSQATPDTVPSRVSKDADVKEWLKRQVLPTFWRDHAETGYDDLMAWFGEMYNQMKGQSSARG